MKYHFYWWGCEKNFNVILFSLGFLFVFKFLAVLGLGYCAGFSLVVESRGYSLRVVCMLLIVVKVKVAQSGPTLCDPMDYTVHGILQARILEWVVFPFSRGSSQPRNGAQVSRIAGGFVTSWATGEALSLWWLLCCRAQALRHAGSAAATHWLWDTGSAVWCPGLVVPEHVGSSWPRNQTHVSYICRRILCHWATREALIIFSFEEAVIK